MMIMTLRSCQDDHVMIRKGELHLTESVWSKQCKDNDNENDNYIYTDKDKDKDKDKNKNKDKGQGIGSD